MKTIVIDVLLTLFAVYTIVKINYEKSKKIFFTIILFFIIVYNIAHSIVYYNLNLDYTWLKKNHVNYVIYFCLQKSFFYVQVFMEYYVLYELYKMIRVNVKRLKGVKK